MFGGYGIFQTLLKTKEAVSTREKEAERDVNKTFKAIEAIAKQQEPLSTMD